MIAAAASIAYAWRVVTAGGVGANIGAGIAITLEPLLLALIITVVVLLEAPPGGLNTKPVWVVITGVWLIAWLPTVWLFWP